MADAPAAERRRGRLPVAIACVLLLIGAYALLPSDDAPGNVVSERSESSDGALDVIEVIPNVPTPGSAMEVRFVGRGGDDLRALLSQTAHQPELKLALPVLHRQEGRIVVRLPREARPGAAKLRLLRGSEGTPSFERSKPYDLRVEPWAYRKIFRHVVGGLALFVLGLLTISHGTRAYADQRGQGLLARLARRTPAAMAVGAVVGGLTQFTTTAAGLVVGVVQAHLLAIGPAVAVLLGAQLGAVATLTVAGLATAREGLLVVTVGVLLTVFADDRRAKALARVVLGCGLLVFGLHLVQGGFGPLVSDPELLPYLDLFDAGTVAGLLRCVGAGVVLAAMLQGPAPVLVLVIGLAEASGRLSLASGLAVMAGTGLGAALACLALAAPFGRDARRMATLHLVLAGAGTLLLAVAARPLSALVDRVVAQDAHALVTGARSMLPHYGRHLLTGTFLGQLAAVVLMGSLLPLLRKLGERAPATLSETPRDGELGGPQAVQRGLVRVLTLHRKALSGVLDFCLSGRRAQGADTEHALLDARRELERLFAGAIRSRSHEPEIAQLRQAALGTLQLQRGLEDLLRQAELSTERHLALLPPDGSWHVGPGDKVVLEGLHGLLIEGLDALLAQLGSGAGPDLDQARAREIRINALEMETRQALIDDADRGEESRQIALRLTNTELVNAYEHVGNHLYRLTEALAAEVEQDLLQAV